MPGTVQTIRLTEYVASGPGLRVDREKGILFGVKVLGSRSENNREYPAATRQAAAKLYEGAKVNIDHPTKPNEPRPLSSRYGILRNIRQQEGEGPFGDLHFNPCHPLAETILWWAENDPSAIGLSHNAEGRVRTDPKTGRDIVEEITTVHSVDLVSDPATTRGLFESRKVMTKTAKQILRAVFTTSRQVKILEQMEMGGEVAQAMDAAVEVVEPEVTPEEQAAAAFKAMIIAVLDDAGLDKAGKLAKIKEILTAEEKLVGTLSAEEEPAEEEPAPAPEEEPVPATEAKRTKEITGKTLRENIYLRRKIRARELCDDAGIVPSRILRRALEGTKTDSEMKSLIEEEKALGQGVANGYGKPRSGRPIPESRGGTNIPEKVEDLAGWLRN